MRRKTRRSGLSAGALRMPDTSEVAGDYSPAWSLLLLRFVSCEDSDLRLAGSDSYLTEVFPRYQCRRYDGKQMTIRAINIAFCCFIACFSLPFST